MRHKYVHNTCVRCGIKRKPKAWKKRMAMIGSRDFYMRGCDMAYSKDDFKTWVYKSPECKEPDNPQAVAAFRNFLHQSTAE